MVLLYPSQLVLICLQVAIVTSISCPFYAQGPFQVITNNLQFNQHELLRGFFTYKLKEFEHDDSRLYEFESTYLDEYSESRFQLNGLPNSTVQLTINNLPIHYIAYANLKGIGQDIISSKKVLEKQQLKKIDVNIRYDQVLIDIQVYKDETTGNPKFRLLRVQSIVNQETLSNVRYKMVLDGDQIIKILQTQLEDRLFDSYKWNARNWFDSLPYGSQLLGGILFSFFQKVDFPTFSNDSMVYCPQFLGNSRDYFEQSEYDSQQLPGANPYHLRVQLSQDQFNHEMTKLHESDVTLNIPLPESYKETALKLLKDKFKPFVGAHSFTMQAFFSEDVFYHFWGGDYNESSIQISHDGNITLQQNLGLYITTFDRNDNYITTVTALIKLDMKIQLQDQQRLTHSNKEKRPIVKIHHIHVTGLQVYDEKNYLFKFESMMALVGLNLEISKFVEGFDKQYDDALEMAAFKGYLGDISIPQPKDAMGFHWIRLHTEAREDKSFSFVFNFDVEKSLVDPDRFESDFKYLFKEDYFEKVKKQYRDQVSRQTICKDFFSPLTPLLTIWCKEEVEGQNLDDQAAQRCVNAWNCVQDMYFNSMQGTSGKLMKEYNGKLYYPRFQTLFKIHCAIGLVFYLFIRLYIKDEQKKVTTLPQ